MSTSSEMTRSSVCVGAFKWCERPSVQYSRGFSGSFVHATINLDVKVPCYS